MSFRRKESAKKFKNIKYYASVILITCNKIFILKKSFVTPFAHIVQARCPVLDHRLLPSQLFPPYATKLFLCNKLLANT